MNNNHSLQPFLLVFCLLSSLHCGGMESIESSSRVPSISETRIYSHTEHSTESIQVVYHNHVPISVDDAPITEGDILVRPSVTSLPESFLGLDTSARRWAEKTIPYDLSTISPTDSLLPYILEAMNTWSRTAGFRFIPRTNCYYAPNYVRFYVLPDCTGAACVGGYSYVGVQGGAQTIALARILDIRPALHEIGHAIGLQHEHTRADRDAYITVNTSNIIPAFLYAFIVNAGSVVGAYDFDSIMHYSSWAFAIDGAGPTIIKKDGTTITAARNLSYLDIEGAKRFYARASVFPGVDHNDCGSGPIPGRCDPPKPYLCHCEGTDTCTATVADCNNLISHHLCP